MATGRWCLGFVLISTLALGQQNRYVVTFTTKQGTSFSVQEPTAFLSAKAIARRSKNSVPVTSDDLPVVPAFVTQLRAAGVEVYHKSRWLNAALIQALPNQIANIRSLPFVARVDYVAPGRRLTPGRTQSKNNVRDRSSASAAAATRTQLQMLGLTTMLDEPITGRNVNVAVFDSGFEGVATIPFFRHLTTDNRLKDTFDFVARSNNIYQYDDHGTEVLSIMGAFDPDTFVGGSHGANYYLYVTEDIASEYRVEEWNWLFAAERADSAGVDVIVASLGYNTFDDASMNYRTSDLNGTTAVVSRAATEAAKRGIIVVTSAGNEGADPSWRLVTPPGDAIGTLAIGSVNTAGTRSSFSSLGPTTDGRLKPEFVALGSGTSLIRRNGVVSTGSGTSYAAPLVASLAAGILQKYPELTREQLLAAMQQSASQASAPNNQIGYGIPSYPAIVDFFESQKVDEPIEIYPNPAGNVLSIRIRQGLQEEIRVQLTDVAGRLQLDRTIKITRQYDPIDLDLSPLAAGIYFVKVHRANDSKLIRLVKQ
jgi:subtilisin family serine protease